MTTATLQPAFGQSATPGSAITLDPIVVEGEPAPASDDFRRLDSLPGSTALITRDDMTGRADTTLSDTIGTVPGVVVQNFFGGYDQPRVQIRGSGLQQNPVERGILILQDGLPLNRADGSYIIGFADPRQAEFTEIYQGYIANRLGATVLGGAINFSSPNGSVMPGVEASAEGGSFGYVNTTARAGGRSGDFDGQVQASYLRRDGFREYNDSQRVNVNLNTGAKLNENVSTRFYAGYTDLTFDVPGPLTWSLLESDPKQVYTGPTVTLPGPTVSNPGPDVARDRPRREASQARVGSRTSATFDAHLLDLGLGYTYTDDNFRFPIASGIRDTDGGDLTATIRYAYSPDKRRPLPLFETTLLYGTGSADRKFYQNNSGETGALFGDNALKATTLSLHAGLNVPLGDRFTLSPAISYAYAVRKNDDQYGSGTRPVSGYNPVTGAFQTFSALPQDTSYSRSYTGWSPSLGLTYDVAPENTLFAAVSRSFEPPTHDDLLSTINGTPFYSPGAPAEGTAQYAFATPDLKAQTATTIEGGWRGRHDGMQWSVTAYYSWIDDELLSLRDSSGTQLPSVNADRTTHFGAAVGIATPIVGDLSGRLAYTYQDFRFDDDPDYGDNRLAGAPQHVIKAALRYAFLPNWFVEGEANWVPGETPVDNANTLYNKSWVTFDLRTHYALGETAGFFGEIRNLLDEDYASSTLITDQAQDNQAAFLPGDGRSFIAGLKIRM